MMAACLAQGRTLLSNVARVPEIADLACFLTNTGAHFEGVGTDKICIYGKSQLLGTQHTIMPDRIEAGTFMLAAAITRSCISLSPIYHDCLSSLIDKLSRAGCRITHKYDKLELSAIPRSSREDLRGFDIKTLPCPGFPTDLQPPTMAMLSTCDGLSIVEESVFENRFTHVKELQKFGTRIYNEGSTARIYGKGKGDKLHGARVGAADLRVLILTKCWSLGLWWHLGARTRCSGGISAKVYESYEAVLDDLEVEAMYVPLPTSLHIKWAVLAVQRPQNKNIVPGNGVCHQLDEASGGQGARCRTRSLLAVLALWAGWPWCCEAHCRNHLYRSGAYDGGVDRRKL